MQVEQQTPFVDVHDHLVVMKSEQDNIPAIRAARESEDYIEVDPYSLMQEESRKQSMTATSLRGKDKIVVPPVLFYNKAMTEVVSAIHLGKNLCGHAGIIHGGMIATLLDEILGCVAFANLPKRVGFTANLNIDYRNPLPADQWVVLRGRLDRVEGRKAFVEAWIESVDGETRYSEAKSLYIGPK
ncbi:HotDog domain-containing protein [Dichotomocladium elegans]|nr:HotDog domain-containing protein [Dichotomocladium elegans]